MITVEQFLASADREKEICRHLHQQIPEDQFDWSPGEKIRTNLELLRYLTRCGAAPAQALIAGTWDNIREDAQKNASMSAPEFPAKMEEQHEELRSLLSPLSEEDLRSRKAVMPWGEECSLGEGIINTSLKFLSAYRLQLFLHVKLLGRVDLGTADCWFGATPPRP